MVSPFVYFSSSLKPWQATRKFPFLLQEVLYPFEYFWNQSLNLVKGSWGTYFYLVDTAKENVVLKRKLALIEAEITDYEHQVQENSRLRKLLGFADRFNKSLIVAEIVGLSGDSPFQYLRINRGLDSLLKVGMPVLVGSGVVGRLLRIGSTFSDVQLIGDTSFNLDVIVERNRVRGVLKGIGDNRCRLLLHRHADIRINDTVVTSGITGSFPKGLPVGRVIRISYESDDVSQIITIQPWVDNYGLEEVILLRYSDPAIETISEIGGDKWLKDAVGTLSAQLHN